MEEQMKKIVSIKNRNIFKRNGISALKFMIKRTVISEVGF